MSTSVFRSSSHSLKAIEIIGNFIIFLLSALFCGIQSLIHGDGASNSDSLSSGWKAKFLKRKNPDPSIDGPGFYISP